MIFEGNKNFLIVPYITTKHFTLSMPLKPFISKTPIGVRFFLNLEMY